jgi:DNA-binding NarL/FixJ family response regulator
MTSSDAPSAARTGEHGEPIRVLIVDDQALVRVGFRMILEIEPDLRVVGEAADGDQAVARALDLQPDVVLMDVRMPGTDGIAATRRLTEVEQCGARVVMLTTFDMDEYVYEALHAGASGFLLKDVQPELLVAGIRAVHSGESLLAPTVTRRMIESFLDRPRTIDHTARDRLTSLTARESETLQLIARGLTNAEIASELFVSETTVKTHVGRILMKLGLRDRVQAVIFAYETGLVTGGGRGHEGGPDTRR